MKTLNIYLNFSGTTEKAFNFYKSAFGKEFSTFQRFKDVPGSEKMLAEVQELMMHVALPLTDAVTLMGSDTNAEMRKNLTVGNNVHLSIEAESKEETERVFNILSAGGKVTMALGDTFWGAYYGSCVDQFGVSWLINYTYPKK